MPLHPTELEPCANRCAAAFTPERLMAAVRADRGLSEQTVPPLCVLDFDGDLSDHLAVQGVSTLWSSWACFHTSMRGLTLDGVSCGIVPRTIGGPYMPYWLPSKLWAAGARLIVVLQLRNVCLSAPSRPLRSRSTRDWRARAMARASEVDRDVRRR